MREQWPTEPTDTQGNLMGSLKASSDADAYDDWISTLNASDSTDGHQEPASNVPDITGTMAKVPDSPQSAEGVSKHNHTIKGHASNGEGVIPTDLPSAKSPSDVPPELDSLKHRESGLTGSQNESLGSGQYDTQVVREVDSSRIGRAHPIISEIDRTPTEVDNTKTNCDLNKPERWVNPPNNDELIGPPKLSGFMPRPVSILAESKDARTDSSSIAHQSSHFHFSSHSNTDSIAPVVSSDQNRAEPEGAQRSTSGAHDYLSVDAPGRRNLQMAVELPAALDKNLEDSEPGFATVMETQQVESASEEVIARNSIDGDVLRKLSDPAPESIVTAGEFAERPAETHSNKLNKTSSEADARVVSSAVDIPQETHSKWPGFSDPQEPDQENVFTAADGNYSWISTESQAQPSNLRALSGTSSGEPRHAIIETTSVPRIEENMDNLWTEALGASQAGPGASWDAVFEDMFEEDGFLEDETADMANLPQTTIISNTSTHSIISNAHIPTTMASSYGVVHPLRPTIPPQSTSIPAPTQFFEELPSLQNTRRKPKQQVVSYSQPSIPVLASQGRPMPPPRQSSAQYSQLRMPERLETFPRQDATRSVSFRQPIPTPHTDPPQPAPSINSRYSPVPSQPSAPASRPANVPPSITSRYFSTPLPLPTSGTAAANQISPLNSTYIPAASQFTTRPASSGNPQAITFFPSHHHTSAVVPSITPPIHEPRYTSSSASFGAPSRVRSPPTARSILDYATEATDLSRPLPPPPVNRFAPRTSSPLAHSDQRPQYDRSVTAPIPMNAAPDYARHYSENRDTIESSFGTHDRHAVEMSSDESVLHPDGTLPGRGPSTSGPLSDGVPHRYSPSFPSIASPLTLGLPPTRQLSYMPQQEHQLPTLDFSDTPQRPRTQSPETTKSLPPLSTAPIARPASAQIPSSPPLVPVVRNRLPFARQQQHQLTDINFTVPNTELASDHLQRWKGYPVFHWNASGTISSSFPQRVPRYGAGQAAPVFKCVPGEVKLRKVKTVLPVDDIFSSFPGPLKSKNKKKDVIAWLTSRITRLELESTDSQFQSVKAYNLQPRLGERILLWRTIQIMVEHDGVLSGNSSVDLAVRQMFSTLMPHDIQDPSYLINPPSDINATSTPNSAKPVMVNSHALNDIKKHLRDGQREKAVWLAVDNSLWAHAMLISSTLDKTIWKQVVQEFVRKEVRNVRRDNVSLAALFEVFGGNWDESVDELVPSSARTGFQMVSTTEAPGHSQNVLDGLNQWQETVALVLSNRSSGDESALLALGKLLAGYGRIEAAHVCYLFSRSVAHFGGSDDPRSSFTLLGADLTSLGSETGYDLDAILLSEVHEFASSLLTPTSSLNMPHLQAFKLYHAYALADSGHRDDAMRYCEAIAAAMKSNTKASPYYHTTLLAQLDDLGKRLSQSPSDAQSSWLSKPSIGKVSGSVWARFNSFVAGDEKSGPSNSPGDHSDHEAGLFGRLTGGTPTISRSNSGLDIYSPEFEGVPSSTAGSSRYAPAPFAPQPSQEFERSSLHPPAQPPYQPLDQVQPSFGTSPTASRLYRPTSQLLRYQSLGPHGPANLMNRGDSASTPLEPLAPIAHPGYSAQPQTLSYQPSLTSSVEGRSSFEIDSLPQGNPSNGYGPTHKNYTPSASSFDSPISGYEPPIGGYEPYVDGYDPSSYQPYQPTTSDDDDNSLEGARKNQSVMEDDDPANSKKRLRASKDKEADDAFRKAAEADTARDARDKGDKKGWFGGGWFGKKDPNAPTVHKAKLGEESSFVFDAETKRWVNKKAGATQEAAPLAAAPPPRGSLSRQVSGIGSFSSPVGGGAPPMKQPPLAAGSSTMNRSISAGLPPAGSSAMASVYGNGNETPASLAGIGAGNASTASLPTVGSAPPIEPPSRPATSMSGATDPMDELIGGAQARKGGTIKKGKKGVRYVDVMAK